MLLYSIYFIITFISSFYYLNTSALQCFYGTETQYSNYTTGNFTLLECEELQEYCVSSVSSYPSYKIYVKACGDICQSKGCHSGGGTKVCCCKGNACNSSCNIHYNIILLLFILLMR